MEFVKQLLVTVGLLLNQVDRPPSAVRPVIALNQHQPPRLLIVVAPESYHEALSPWIERRRRQGFDVQTIDPISTVKSPQSAEAVSELRDKIKLLVSDHLQQADDNRGVPAGYVLLVGDAPAPTEPLDTKLLIPGAIELAKSYPRERRRFISDNVYSLPGEHGQPRLAVGRWPVRSSDEVATQVQKSIAYEVAPASPDRRNVTLIATTPNYDPFFDPILERMAMGLINGNLKSHWGLRAIYASPRSDYFPGPEETQRQVVRWLEESTPFTLFAGHGFDCGVDVVRYEGRYYSVLDSRIAETVHGSRPGTVLWMSACSCGDFDLPPPQRGLAEALVMNSNGPTAVIAGTDETSAYANLLLCLGLARDVLEQPPDTLGEAFLRFKQAAFKPGPPLLKNLLLSMEPTENPAALAEDHQYLYNLLGDPTLAIHLPHRMEFAADVTERANSDSDQRIFSVAGRCDVESGTAWVSLTIDRMQLKDPAVSGTKVSGSDRRGGYVERFQAANDKTAAAGTVRVTGGHFELDLSIDTTLAQRVRWLQVYIQPDTGSAECVAAQAVRLTDDSDQ